MPHRPLSPHVFIYRFAYTMAMSICHRATGVALSAALLLLVAWLAAVAAGPDSYAAFAAFAAGWPARIVFGLAIVAFLFHLSNGIRHLLWDAGIGLEKGQARVSWKIVMAVVLVGSALLIYLLLGGVPA